ncbi:unnamed protein product [Lathyrus sativus]|nr:unnamed protein product [Lathyrus sativus]
MEYFHRSVHSRSIELLLEKVIAFSRATGLFVNSSKCNVYYGGVEQTVKNNIYGITFFPNGNLPFRYLGVPLTSRKLSISHYMGLVDRIVKRIKHWSLKLLSYASRVQLIQSVATAMTSY